MPNFEIILTTLISGSNRRAGKEDGYPLDNGSIILRMRFMIN